MSRANNLNQIQEDMTMTMLEKMNKISQNEEATTLANKFMADAAARGETGYFQDMVDLVYTIYFEKN